jgi:hypothetical protein
MPRKSTAALAVAPVLIRTPRLRAPADLAPAQLALWHTVVDTLPGDYFSPEQAQLLRSYVTHAALADDLAQRLLTLDPMADGWSKLSVAQVSHSKAALAFARSLRLTNQSRVQPDTAATKARAGGPATLELLRTRYGVQE